MDPHVKRYSPQLEEVSLGISELSCRCWTWPVPRTQAIAGLVEFAGSYRRGSAGGDDAQFIRWRIAELCELRLPSVIAGLVVDLRSLDYKWGDDLTVEVGRIVENNGPLLVVVAPGCIDDFRHAIRGERLRTDLQIAFAEVAGQVQRLRSGSPQRQP